jgi:hypothetical protein
MRSDKVPVWSLSVVYVSGFIWYNFNGGGGGWQSNTISPTTPGNWHHVALTITPGQPPLFYFDGVLKSSLAGTPFAGPLNSLPSDYMVLGDQKAFFGQLDDVQIYLDFLPVKHVRFLFQYPGKRLPAGDVDKDGIGDMCGKLIRTILSSECFMLIDIR